MRFCILALAALIGLTSLSTAADAQVVAQYYGWSGYSRSFDHDGYHQRYRRWYNLRSQQRFSPYHRSVPNYRYYNRYFNNYGHRRYHRGFGRRPYSTFYRRPGIYYQSPGFGFRFSF